MIASQPNPLLRYSQQLLPPLFTRCLAILFFNYVLNIGTAHVAPLLFTKPDDILRFDSFLGKGELQMSWGASVLAM